MNELQSREVYEHEAFIRSGYRCEKVHTSWDYKQGDISVRCPEEHVKPAKTYKGRVVLKPFPLTRTPRGPEDILILCNHCLTKEVEESIKNARPRKPQKYKGTNRRSIF